MKIASCNSLFWKIRIVFSVFSYCISTHTNVMDEADRFADFRTYGVRLWLSNEKRRADNRRVKKHRSTGDINLPKRSRTKPLNLITVTTPKASTKVPTKATTPKASTKAPTKATTPKASTKTPTKARNEPSTTNKLSRKSLPKSGITFYWSSLVVTIAFLF